MRKEKIEKGKEETSLRSDELRRGKEEKVVETVRTGGTVYVDPPKAGSKEGKP